MSYKAYPAYKDSGVEWLGAIPEEWEPKRLRFVGSYQNSNVDKKSYEDQKTVRLCNYTDVYYNEKITNKLEFMESTASDNEIDAMTLKHGDIIITKDSENPHDIGIPAIVSEDLDNVVCGYHLTVIRTPDFATANYLFRAIQGDISKAQFYVESPGVTRFGLNQDTIGSLWVALPPIELRSIIAAFLDKQTGLIDEMIEKKSRFIELLKEKRQALITHAVTKGINPDVKMKDSGVEWLGKIPEHWSILPFLAVAKERKVKNKGMIENNLLSLSYGNIISKDINTTFGLLPESFETYQLIFKDDIVFRLTDLQNDKKSLRSAICKEDGIITSAYLAVSNTDNMHADYFNYLMRAYDVMKVFYAMGGGMRQSLKYEDMKRLPVVLPNDFDEQKKIAEFIDNETTLIDSLISKTEESINLLKEKRSALITAAVTGKIDVREEA